MPLCQDYPHGSFQIVDRPIRSEAPTHRCFHDGVSVQANEDCAVGVDVYFQFMKRNHERVGPVQACIFEQIGERHALLEGGAMRVYLTSLMGEYTKLESIFTVTSPYGHTSFEGDNLQKMIKYQIHFTAGPPSGSVQPADSTYYIGVTYGAEWYYYAVLNQLSYIYGVPYDPSWWVTRLTDHWEDTVWFDY